jgi:hypothetical protein
MSFWRRSRGRHALGAAVASIPAVSETLHPTTGAPAPHAPAPHAPAPHAPAPHAPAPRPPSDVPGESASVASAAPEWSFPELHPPQEAALTGPRVELTFRDGTSAALDGTQARALDEIARALTRRD